MLRQHNLLPEAILVTLGWRGLVAPLSIFANRTSCCLACLLIIACSLGCGESVVVGGQVMFQGKPIKHGTIQFRPETGRAKSSEIADGKYQFSPEKIQPGEYRVRVFAQEETGRMIPAPDRWKEDAPTSAPEFVQVLPERYNTKTTLTATVVSGTNELDFTLD